MSTGQQRIRVVSFDAEGTLASHAFSRRIWQEVVPALYGELHGLEFEEAAERVFAEYATIGPGRPEWYDIGYWFRRLGLGEAGPVIESQRSLIEFYPDVQPVLEALRGRFLLVVASSTPLEFLRPLLRDVEQSFCRMFSSTSSCGRLKDADFFRWLSSEIGCEPSEIAHVGDHVVRDFEASAAAGLVSFYLDRTGRSDSALRNLTELLPHLCPGEET